MTALRISSITSHLAQNPMTAKSKLPKYDELPHFKNFPGCAWEVWGKGDQLGTVNLLTDEVVKKAASEEIRTGKSITLNWPVNFPAKPMYNRKPPEILIKSTVRNTRDDEIHINTQSGTQWDGMKHFGIVEHAVCYGGAKPEDLIDGQLPPMHPGKIDDKAKRLGIQNWAQHGICGRAVLLDLVKHFRGKLPYDPWTTHAVPLSDLLACAKEQGTEFREGDILLVRVGFMKRFNEASDAERDGLRGKPETFAGLEQTEEMKRFLWDNHFAAVASDQPALERWPTPEGVPHLHQTLLGLWGMPIGEFFDLEALAEHCNATGRYSFFFTSWPLNVIGGCASPPNAAAMF